MRAVEPVFPAPKLGRRATDQEQFAGSGRRASDREFPAASPGRRASDPVFSFAGLRLEADGTLWRGEAVVHLPPKELAALRLLMAHAGQVVSPLQLKRALWGDVHVTADSVPKCLSSLRARLEPDDCIQTVYKRGYRFSAEIARHSVASDGAPPRLAILPFETRYMVPEFLGPAIAEETISALASARPPAVFVLARDSVFNLAQRGLTAQQIGKELKADLVLTGSLQAFTSHCRLRAEMIRVEDGVQIWVEDLLGPHTWTGEIEKELLQRLYHRIGALPRGDRSLLPAPSMEGLEIFASASASRFDEERGLQQREAYETYLRGHHEWQTLHRHRMQDGLQHLLRAIELDPTLIAAKVDLAHLCVTQAFYGFMPPDVAADHVHRAAESIPDHALRAPTLLPALGWIEFHYDRDLAAARQAFSESAHLPHDSWITRARSMFAVSRHRFGEAIGLLRGAIRLDPYSPWLQGRLAWTLHLDGQADESVELIKKAISLFPEHEFIGFYGALILGYNGEAARAVEVAQDLALRLPHFDLAAAAHAYTLACAGRKDEARVILERLQWLSRERFLLNSFTPAVLVALGDLEEAINELQAADQARCPWFFQMLADPRLKALHGHREFERMRATLAAMEAEATEKLGSED
jgi:DNA-binding winged helix-turn-helix (wHTH) protein/tetratricopeptide (TPR) repeat protein